MELSRILSSFDKVSEFGAIASGWALLGLSFLVGIDVVCRKIFNLSLQGADEIGGYVLAIACTFGFSWALKEKAHIRLGLLLPKLSRPFRIMLNFMAFLSFTCFAYMMLWRGVAMLIETIQLRAVAPTPLETPLVIPQSIWVLGLFWFSLHLSCYSIGFTIYIFRNQYDELLDRFGID